jgi:GNAT superfamily N-acetyltransferase
MRLLGSMIVESGSGLSTAFPKEKRWVGFGETYLALVDDMPAGTISLDTSGEPFWSPQEAQSSLFIHRLAVVRAHAGRGLGKALLDFARSEAERRGCNWLRLDCVGDNESLKTYYKHEGFTLIKTVPLPHDDSEALFAQRMNRLSDPGENLKSFLDRSISS